MRIYLGRMEYDAQQKPFFESAYHFHQILKAVGDGGFASNKDSGPFPHIWYCVPNIDSGERPPVAEAPDLNRLPKELPKLLSLGHSVMRSIYFVDYRNLLTLCRGLRLRLMQEVALISRRFFFAAKATPMATFFHPTFHGGVTGNSVGASVCHPSAS